MANNDDDFPSVGKVVFWIIAILVALMLLGWAIKGNDFFMYKFFAPKEEAVRRETYENTKSYKQGSIQRLDSLCDQVANADENHKPMLNDIIKHEFAEWSMDDVPDYLRPCLSTARAKSKAQ